MIDLAQARRLSHKRMHILDHFIYRIRYGRTPTPSSAGTTVSHGTDPADHQGRGHLGHEDGQTAQPPLLAPSGGTPGHIVRARREFVDQFSHLARGKRNWQIVAFASLGLLFVVTLAYIQLASSTRITPYVVEVDELGQARAFGPAERIEAVDDRITLAQLSAFIRNIRTVYQDPMAQREMIVRAYAFVEAPAREWLNGYFRDPENDPRVLARRLSRRVEIKSVIALPESESWKVSWIEIETPNGTGTERRMAWEGYLTVKQVPPTSAAAIEYNPLGLYITAINWTQVTQG